MNIFTVFLFALSVYASDCLLQSSHSKVGDNHEILFEDEYFTTLEENSISMPQCNTEGEHFSQSNVCVKPKHLLYYAAPTPSRPPFPDCSVRKVPYGMELDMDEEKDRIEFEKVVETNLTDTGYMDNYDLRIKNVTCPSIIEISNQGCCDSCWAVAATDVMTDRLCLRTNGTNTTRYSVMDLLSCCSYCRTKDIKPCENAGIHSRAWVYWTDKGIVSGHYNKKYRIGCRNYHVNPYTHDLTKVRNEKKNLTETENCSVSTMSCPSVKYEVEPTCNRGKQECDDAWTGRSYTEDRMKGEECYYMVRQFDGREAAIKLEILLNGPVHAYMSVYHDFYVNFTSNYNDFHEVDPYVHEEEENNRCAAHSIRIVGWGKKGDTSYWIVANSYGEEWGDQGFFHLDFNHDKNKTYKTTGKEKVYAGIPKLN